METTQEKAQASYDGGGMNPIAFTGSTAAMSWVLSNVFNPNYSLLKTNPLPNTRQIVSVGSPQSRWTLTDSARIPVQA